MIEDPAHHILNAVPVLLGADVFLAVVGIPLGETVGYVLIQTDSFEHEGRELDAALEFILELLGRTHQMTFGNGELTDADQTVHLAARLVAEERGGLVVTKRQIAVGTLLVEICLILEGTGHRTERVDLVVVVGIAENEHAVLVVIPVTADLVEVALCHKGRFGEQPAALLFLVLDKALQELDHSCALGKQDRKSLTDIVDSGKEAHLSAQLIVVALSGFLELREVFLEHGSLGERHAVDTAELRLGRVAAPIGAGAVGQRDRLDRRYAHQVRSRAEVDKLALLIEADVLALVAVLGSKLDLIRLVHALQLGDRFLGRKLKALDRVTFLDDLFHLRLDFLQILCGERLFNVEIIVESAVDGRTNGALGARIESLDSLRQYVGRGMPEGVLAFLIIKGEKLHLAVFSDGSAQVADLTVDGRSAYGLVQAHTNGFCDFSWRNAGFKFFDNAYSLRNIGTMSVVVPPNFNACAFSLQPSRG